jgi:hypothetical protein
MMLDLGTWAHFGGVTCLAQGPVEIRVECGGRGHGVFHQKEPEGVHMIEWA